YIFSSCIDVQDLPTYLHAKRALTYSPTQQPDSTGESSLEEQERQLVVQALDAAKGNQSQAARELRIGRDALRYKMKKYSLDAIRS
ncbi:MAG: helix-turn-helix domain-containing protein, partial [Acidobacteriota bacterium]